MAPLNGGMKEESCGHYFSSGRGSRGRPWGGARSAGGGVLRTLLRCKRRKKTASWVVRAGWAGYEAEPQWGEGRAAD
jgi:hypothetical protein